MAREIYLGHDGTDESKVEAKKKADAALERLKKDDVFADVARSVSEAEDSKTKGGELGCVGKDARLPKPVVRPRHRAERQGTPGHRGAGLQSAPSFGIRKKFEGGAGVR